MSSIKKYIGGETKEWIKFAETNVDPKELSSARNISVEFGQHSSVNDILKDHDDAIQSLKRNVSWLALHGGGGSGTGGGSSTARKASCQILVNDGSGPVSISKGQSLFVTLQNFKGSDTSVPWTIICTIDGETVFQTNKAQGILEKIQIETEWDYISRFFEGEASKKNHSLCVSATYKDENIEGGSGIETSIYIPNVEFGVNGLTDRIDVRTAVQSILWINTALKGWFRLCVRSFNGKTLVLENSFPPTEKTNDQHE